MRLITTTLQTILTAAGVLSPIGMTATASEHAPIAGALIPPCALPAWNPLWDLQTVTRSLCLSGMTQPTKIGVTHPSKMRPAMLAQRKRIVACPIPPLVRLSMRCESDGVSSSPLWLYASTIFPTSFESWKLSV